jgi:hypothetical protein
MENPTFTVTPKALDLVAKIVEMAGENKGRRYIMKGEN